MAATVPAGTAVQGEREETTEKDRHTTSGRRHAVATLDELVYSRRSDVMSGTVVGGM